MSELDRESSARGSREALDATLVTPETVAEVDADLTIDCGTWRHPLRFVRLRLDVTFADVPAGLRRRRHPGRRMTAWHVTLWWTRHGGPGRAVEEGRLVSGRSEIRTGATGTLTVSEGTASELGLGEHRYSG
ncbi:hypothetical protein [Streptomyces sp. NPDC023838]|uniref:hypothetical protein n=1 Tax=Streptomyces sp. NPDC023838 TaxID=3154325 RepID=UPI0033CE4157